MLNKGLARHNVWDGVLIVRKYNVIEVFRESLWLASTTYLLDLSEYLLEAYEADTVYIRNYPLDIEDYTGTPSPEVIVPTNIIDEEELMVALELVDKNFLNPKVVFVEKSGSIPFDSIDYLSLYDRAIEVFYKLAYKLLRPLLAPRANEYLVAVFENAKTAILEGNRNNVRIPLTKRFKTRFMAHTHPSGMCIPSHKDMESITRLLMDGGFGEVIISPTCSIAVYRRGMFISEDYEKMIVIARKIYKAKNILEVLRILANAQKELKSVKIVNI